MKIIFKDPGSFSTEWGVYCRTPSGEESTTHVKSQESARTMVENMSAAGYHAKVVWRAVSSWHPSDMD